MTTPYEEFGGPDFFEALVADFYTGVAADPDLRPMYPEEDLGPAQRRLRMFLEQYWGGPRTYSEERGHPRLRMRHAPFEITEHHRDVMAQAHARRAQRPRTPTGTGCTDVGLPRDGGQQHDQPAHKRRARHATGSTHPHVSRDAQARGLSDTYGMRLLVTGATGYIGGRLIPQLLGRGHEVRVLARHPERLSERSWADRVEVFAGDATDPDAVRAAMTGMDGAYYLMHSLTAGHGFEEQERAMATTFARSAEQAGLKRIVYLGGMVPDVPPRKLSAHLRSRAEVGRILRSSGVPTIELRAGVIIGSGSASFEMLRYLTERLPVMITPLMGEDPHPAHRRARRPVLPRGSDGVRRRGQPRLRHRWPGHHHVRRDDARIRIRRRPATPRVVPCERAVPRPLGALGRPSHASAQQHRQATGRLPEGRSRGPRSRHRGHRPGSAARPPSVP
jgi:uncharacterized protein YbjT (DUF2867 family)/truncated hemoglobin YjbI